MNHFADLTDKEMHHYKGLLNESFHDNEAKQFIPPVIDTDVTPIPKSLDWREYGIPKQIYGCRYFRVKPGFYPA